MKERILGKKYPNSILFVLISSLDYGALIEDSDFKEFVNEVSVKEKSGRLYKIKAKTNKEINNLFSFFTGSRPELNGIKGNLVSDSNKINYFDSIFKRFKKSHIQSNIIGTNFLIFSFA